MEITPESAAIALHLNYLRSAFIVGAVLAGKYQTEDEWQEQLNSPEFLDRLSKFSLQLDNYRKVVQTEDEPTLNTALSAGESYEQFSAPLLNLAETLEIPVEDLLTVFVNS